MQQLELDAAMTNLELANASWLAWARGEAKTLSLLRGSVTSDDMRERCDRYGLQPDSPHAWGALFKCKDFIFIGRTRSRYPSSNGRYIGVWRVAPDKTVRP